MKIYTKKGDDGTTMLLGGTRLPKHHIRIAAYGDIDELNSVLGIVADSFPSFSEEIRSIQNNLFVIGSHFATEPEQASKIQLPQLEENAVQNLELSIDMQTANLPELKHFILPGGHITVSYIHLARTTCRRAERTATALGELSQVNASHLIYINRLSDYLFTLARTAAMELKVEEIKWIPKK
ncbi:MAG: cob(I)yrinic acid a,c-diamide adenosyltransferase [Bacteroidota bacterium]